MTTSTSTAPASDRPPIAYAYLLGFLVGLPAAIVFIRLAQSEGVPALVIAMTRFVLSSLMFLVAILNNGQIKQLASLPLKNVFMAAGAGAFFALHQFFWLGSLEYTTVLVANTVLNTSLLWILLIETTVLKGRPGVFVWLGILFALAGGAYIMVYGLNEGGAFSSNPTLGNIFALFSAIGMAGYLLIGRSQRTNIPAVLYIWIVYTSSSVFGVLALILTQTPVLGYSVQGYIWMLGVTLIAQVIGHSSINMAVRYFSATYVNIIQQFVPAGAALVSFLAFRETPTGAQIIGSGIILVGVVLATLDQLKKRTNNDKDPPRVTSSTQR